MHILRRISLLLGILLLHGCEVPDVQPFLRATADMGATIGQGLRTVVADLNRVVIPDALPLEPPAAHQARAQQQQALRAYQDTLARKAQAFARVGHAFDAYAQALGDAVARGEQTGQRIDRVAAAFTDLLKAAGNFAAIPGGALPAAAANFVHGFATDLNNGLTIRRLDQLATPRQDTLVQQTAKVLRLGLQAFGRVDSAAYGLLRNYRPAYDDWVADLYHNDLARQQLAVQRLRLLAIVRRYQLSGRPALIAGRLRELRQLDSLAGGQQLGAAARSWRAVTDATGQPRPGHPARQAEALRQLTAALDAQESYYRGWLVPPEITALYAETQARTPQPDLAWLAASQQALAKWASTHQLLRQTLATAKRVRSADVTRYSQATKDFVDAVKAAHK